MTTTVDTDTQTSDDNEIECDIPSDLPNFACIQYPGKINKIENVIETLGGNDKIQETFSKYNTFRAHQKESKDTKKLKEPYLELHLNPNGVFDHALFGKIRPIKNCILIKKTTKIAKKNKNKNKSSRKRKRDSNISVMGRITSLVTYDELADFQVFTDLKYPPKKGINNNNDNNNDNNIGIIRKVNKRRRLWSLREDDIPNISKYPLVPQVFASKAVPYDGFLKEGNPKTTTTGKGKEELLETKPTEINFARKQVPNQPKKGSIWMKYVNDLNEYIKDIKHRKIPNRDEAEENKIDIKNRKTKHSFCDKIRNELILQIKSYFELTPIWTKNEILIQKFYIYWYHIKYFADKIEVRDESNNNNNNNNNNNDGGSDTFYDFDIASIIFERKKKNNFYFTALNSRNMEKQREHHNDHRLLQISPKLIAHKNGKNAELDNTEKIYLDFKEKERIISKFLGVVGYKFKNGPFRNSSIKFGFDPRHYSNKNISRSLQIIDYRINKQNGKKLGIETIWQNTGSRVGNRGKPNTQKTITPNISSWIDMMNNQQINYQPKSIRNEKFLAKEMVDDNVEFDDDGQIMDEKEILDRLHFTIKPDKLQMYYQLKNIDITEIQDIINNSDPNSYNKECERKHGWLLKKDEAKIREIMDERLQSWIDKETKNNYKINTNNMSSTVSPQRMNENDDESYDEYDGQLIMDDMNDGDDVFKLL